MDELLTLERTFDSDGTGDRRRYPQPRADAGRAGCGAAPGGRRHRSEVVFPASMSHEIRTPLNGDRHVALCLRDQQLASETRQRWLALSSGESLLTIINDVLDFSKIEAGKLNIESVDFELLPMLFDGLETLSELASTKGLDFIVEADPLLPRYFRGDPTRIRQVRGESGRQRDQVHRQRQGNGDRAWRGLRCPVLRLRFKVSDTGIGIAAMRCRNCSSVSSRPTPAPRANLAAPGWAGDLPPVGRSDGGRSRSAASWARAPRSNSCWRCRSAWRHRSRSSVNRIATVTTGAGGGRRKTNQLDHRNAAGGNGAPGGNRRQRAGSGQGRRTWRFRRGADGRQHAGNGRPRSDARLIRAGGDAGLPVADRTIGIVALTANVTDAHEQTFRAAGMDAFPTKPIEQQALHAALQQVIDARLRQGRICRRCSRLLPKPCRCSRTRARSCAQRYARACRTSCSSWSGWRATWQQRCGRCCTACAPAPAFRRSAAAAVAAADGGGAGQRGTGTRSMPAHSRRGKCCRTDLTRAQQRLSIGAAIAIIRRLQHLPADCPDHESHVCRLPVPAPAGLAGAPAPPIFPFPVSAAPAMLCPMRHTSICAISTITVVSKRDSCRLQLDAALNEQFGATLQGRGGAVGSGRSETSAKPTWAFLSYRPSNDWLLRAGKLRVPVYLHSSNLDVGVTYDMGLLPRECIRCCRPTITRAV